jgi:hypothetical protein
MSSAASAPGQPPAPVFVLRYESADDPFVRSGVVKSWQIRQWNEILGGQR